MAAVANRYARALVDVIIDDKVDPTTAIDQVNDIVAAVNESDQLRMVWQSPAVPSEQKRALLDAIVARTGTIRPIRNFFAILIDHRRISMMAQIARQFERELNTQLGFVEADVTSSRQLSDDEKREIEAQVANITGKKVRSKYDTSPDLLGGALVRVGSTIFDGSVRGQLQRLKQQLASS